MIKVYTDGSCLKNPGVGGYAYYTIDGPEGYGYEEKTTNNRMELRAVIEAIKVHESYEGTIKIYSDSLLTINCAQKLWRRKANKDLWLEYDKNSKGKDIVFVKVKAHSNNYYNDLVDKMAKKACIKKLS